MVSEAAIAHFRTFWLPKLSAPDYICVRWSFVWLGIGDAGPQNACCSPQAPQQMDELFQSGVQCG
jgi:hypothetical protein